MSSNRTVLISGAGGFVGGWLAEIMAILGRYSVTAGVRRWSSAARICRFPVKVKLCDVLDLGQIDNCVQGIDIVVHCAAGNRETNIEGTKNLLTASIRHGVKKFVHLSSIAVYGDAAGRVEESTPLQYTGSDYADSKIESEKISATFAKQGLGVIVLRPTIVYGPYDTLWIGKYADRMRNKNWHTYAGFGDGTCNLMYVVDLVQAILLAMESDFRRGEIFNVNGPEQITWNEYFMKLNDSLELPPLPKKSRVAALLAAQFVTPTKTLARKTVTSFDGILKTVYRNSSAARGAMMRAEKSLVGIPGNEELRMFSRKAIYETSRAERLLGFRPMYGIEEGMDLSVQWYRHERNLENQRVFL